MNIRFDPHSLRIRLTYDEAVRLAEGECLYEAYEVIGLSLELRTLEVPELSFMGLRGGKARVDIPNEELITLLGRLGQSARKKEALAIRGLYWTSQFRCELILEIDIFDLRQKKIRVAMTEL